MRACCSIAHCSWRISARKLGRETWSCGRLHIAHTAGMLMVKTHGHMLVTGLDRMTVQLGGTSMLRPSRVDGWTVAMTTFRRNEYARILSKHKYSGPDRYTRCSVVRAATQMISRQVIDGAGTYKANSILQTLTR